VVINDNAQFSAPVRQQPPFHLGLDLLRVFVVGYPWFVAVELSPDAMFPCALRYPAALR
jgi:hypothetical protein